MLERLKQEILGKGACPAAALMFHNSLHGTPHLRDLVLILEF
jgi:hypothetical protein